MKSMSTNTNAMDTKSAVMENIAANTNTEKIKGITNTKAVAIIMDIITVSFTSGEKNAVETMTVTIVVVSTNTATMIMENTSTNTVAIITIVVITKRKRKKNLAVAVVINVQSAARRQELHGT